MNNNSNNPSYNVIYIGTLITIKYVVGVQFLLKNFIIIW